MITAKLSDSEYVISVAETYIACVQLSFEVSYHTICMSTLATDTPSYSIMLKGSCEHCSPGELKGMIYEMILVQHINSSSIYTLISILHLLS